MTGPERTQDQNQGQGADFSDVAILVAAAGMGTRSGSGLPKQYRRIAGRPVLAITLASLAKAAPGASLVVVIDAAAAELYEQSLADITPAVRAALIEPALGGATRQASVHSGLEALAKFSKLPKIVLIHDAARPFASETLIRRAVLAAREGNASIPALAIADTIKEVDARQRVIATPDRGPLRAVQTPQAFAFELILEAHRRARDAGISGLTDDSAIAEWAGHAVHVFEGEAENFKITTPADLVRAETRLLADLPDIRSGQGFDVHAFCEGDHVWLGGVKIPHGKSLAGHSDADVLMHAVTDAIYGALADGDLGAHFPPSDPQWRGAASEIFLRHAADRIRARGGMIAHIDATVICEYPKVGPHRDAIRARLAAILGIAASRVAVKATTTERLGFAGRGEGVAAMAGATIRLPAVGDDECAGG